MKRFLIAVMLAVAVAAALAAPIAAGDPHLQVTICHRTDSNSNPYVLITVNVNAVDGTMDANHTSHTGPVWDPSLKDRGIQWGDIIPPYSFGPSGDDHYAGLNWTGAGIAIYSNGCLPVLPTPTPTPSPSPTPTPSPAPTASPSPTPHVSPPATPSPTPPPAIVVPTEAPTGTPPATPSATLPPTNSTGSDSSDAPLLGIGLMVLIAGSASALALIARRRS